MEQLEPDGVTAAAAKGEKRIAQQEQCGSGLVRVADFVDAGLLHGLAGIERAIRLVVLRRIWVLLFHESCRFLLA